MISYPVDECPPQLLSTPFVWHDRNEVRDWVYKNKIELNGSNHSKWSKPHELCTATKMEFPFHKARVKCKGKKSKRWTRGGLVGTGNPDCALSDPSSPQSQKAQGIARLLDYENHGNDNHAGSVSFPHPPRTFYIASSLAEDSPMRPGRRKLKGIYRQSRSNATGFRMYQNACQEIPALYQTIDVSPEQIPKEDGPMIPEETEQKYEEPLEQVFYSPELELANENGDDEEEEDDDDDDDESVSDADCDSIFSFSPLGSTMSGILSDPVPSLSPEVANINGNLVGKKEDLPLDDKNDEIQDWDLISDEGSWDEIFEDSDLCSEISDQF